MIGTVALFRMAKRVPVAQHHFRHPCAPRCAVWPGATRRRLPWRRKAAEVRALRTGAARAHDLAGTVLLCCAGVREVIVQHRFCHPLPPSYGRPIGATGRSRRALHRLSAATKRSALLNRAGPGFWLVGPVPLCGGRERAAVV